MDDVKKRPKCRSLMDLCLDETVNLINKGTLPVGRTELTEDLKNLIQRMLMTTQQLYRKSLEILCHQLRVTKIDITGAHMEPFEPLGPTNLSSLRCGAGGSLTVPLRAEQLLSYFFSDFTKVTYLDLSYVRTAENGFLELIQSFGNLEALVLEGVGLKGKQFDFAKMPKLEHLNLSSTNIGSIRGIGQLVNMKILVLHDLNVNERDSRELLHLGSLRYLDISVRKIRNRNLFHLVRYTSEKAVFGEATTTPWPNLSSLDLGGHYIHIDSNVACKVINIIVSAHPLLSWIGLYQSCLSNVNVQFVTRDIRILNSYSPSNLLLVLDKYSKGERPELVLKVLHELERWLRADLNSFTESQIVNIVSLLTETMMNYEDMESCVRTQYHSLNCLLLIFADSKYIEILPQTDAHNLVCRLLVIMEFIVEFTDTPHYDVQLREGSIGKIWQKLNHLISNSETSLRLCDVISRRLESETSNRFRQCLLHTMIHQYSKLDENQRETLVDRHFFISLVYSMRQSSTISVEFGNRHIHGLELDLLILVLDREERCKMFVRHDGLRRLHVHYMGGTRQTIMKTHRIMKILMHFRQLDTYQFVSAPGLLYPLIVIHRRYEDFDDPDMRMLSEDMENFIMYNMRSPMYEYHRRDPNFDPSVHPESLRRVFEAKTDEEMMTFLENSIQNVTSVHFITEILFGLRTIAKGNIELKNRLYQSTSMQWIRGIARAQHQDIEDDFNTTIPLARKIMAER